MTTNIHPIERGLRVAVGLFPLMVGAGETEKAELVHHELFMGAITTSSFKFG